MNLIYLIASFLVIKLALNTSKFLKCKYYLSKYVEWIGGTENNLPENTIQVKELLKGAGIEDAYIPYADPVGWGYISTGSASVMNNFPSARQDIAKLSYQMLSQAAGVYRTRIIETFSPLYWIEFAINLPKHILKYLGLPTENVLIKFTQLVYWALAAVTGFLYALYKTEFENMVKTLIGKLLH